MLINELLYRQRDNPKPAIYQGEQCIKYSEWYKLSMNVSMHIESSGQTISQNIAVFLPNSIQYAVAYFGILFANKTIIPIGVNSKCLEVQSTLEYCDVNFIITSLQHIKSLENILQGFDRHITIVCLDDLSIHTIIKDNVSKVNDYFNNSDVAIMLHTSGTTSDPKRVMLTHDNLKNNIESNIASLQLTKDDVTLIALPMHFGYSNTAQFLTHIYLGATIVILDSVFLPKQFLQTVEKYKITNFTAVPSMLLMLLDYRYAQLRDYSSLKYICFGGSPMPVNKLKELILKFPSISFVQTYGQTECSPRVTALLPPFELEKIGSVGKPLPNVNVKIVDENDCELPNNEIGEILVQGKNIMKGYYKKQQITKEVIVNGWLHTGDLGYYGADGFLYLTGRMKNIIISGGINIYPEEIEHVLLQKDPIADVCVVGEEHPMLGEVPVAKIILKSQINSSALREYCLERLADYKVPVRFDVVSELPKTYNGKTKRNMEGK